MKKINCNIVKDILPLYADGAVSEDTKAMVEEHLQTCENCAREVNSLKSSVEIPANRNVRLAEARTLKKLRTTLLKKKIIISAASVIAAIAVIIGLCSVLTAFRIYIPYDGLAIAVQETDGKLYAQYSGDYLSGIVFHAPTAAEVDGNEKEIAVFYCYETLWSKYVAPIYEEKSNPDAEKSERFLLGEKARIDRVYYGEFESESFMAKAPALSDEWKMIWGE